MGGGSAWRRAAIDSGPNKKRVGGRTISQRRSSEQCRAGLPRPVQGPWSRSLQYTRCCDTAPRWLDDQIVFPPLPFSPGTTASCAQRTLGRPLTKEEYLRDHDGAHDTPHGRAGFRMKLEPVRLSCWDVVLLPPPPTACIFWVGMQS